MKFICEQSQLNAVLSVLVRVVPSRPSHPILADFLIKVSEQSLTIIGFDLSLGISGIVEGEGDGEYSYCVPAKMFFEVISKLPKGELTLDFEGSELSILSGFSYYKINAYDCDEFPELPTINPESKDNITLSPNVLQESLRLVVPTASIDETKQILTGVNFLIVDNVIKIASTDGHRLAVYECESFDLPSLCVTIPSKCLSEISKAIDHKNVEEININYGDGLINFNIGTYSIISRVLDGKYPDYDKLIPKEFSTTLLLNRKQLASSLERIALVSSESKNKIVEFVIGENNQVELFAETADVGSGKEILDATISGDSFKVGFNCKYLIDALKSLTSEEIFIKLNTPGSPVVLLPVGGVKALYLIMPVQIRN